MNPELREPVRIVSDVHWRHSASLVRRADQLAPLAEGAGTVVFNGDTVEQQGRARALEDAGRFRELCRKAGAEAVFVSGNHDPEVSDRGWLELAGGCVLATHGDVLFPEIASWKRGRSELHAACERLSRNESTESFDDLLRSVREACVRVIREGRCPEVGIGFARILARHGWPPVRPLRVLRCWAETGLRGASLAAHRGNGVRFVVMGHTHYPGVWHRNGCVVINTGSFFPVMGGSVVEVDKGFLNVRRVVRRRNAFHLAQLRGRWEV